MCPENTGTHEETQQEIAGIPVEYHDPDHPGTDKPTKKQVVKEQRMTAHEHRLKEAGDIPNDMEHIKKILQEKVGLGVSFDVVLREMSFGGKKCGIFYMNGFAKDSALIEIIKRLTYVEEQEVKGNALEVFQEKLVAHIQVEKAEKFDDVMIKVLSGMTALFIENTGAALLIDAKNYPIRSTEEPDLERVVRGARDGFVETLMTNVTLIRRRIRDPRLKYELVKVGTRTQTDICIAYIQDIASPTLVEAFREKLTKVKIDGLPLGEKQLEEALVKKNGWNPYPLVRYSERPDVVAAHLLEGHVVILADTSPSAMILPSTIFQLMQHAEEYRQTPAVGSYLRFVRYFGAFASLFLLPVWYLMVAHPELKPPGMEWIGPAETGRLPVLVQFLIAEIGIDLMRMAAIHTPSPLSTAMGIIAGLLVGQIAVETGMFVNEVIMYMAVATIGMFATPSYELSLANRVSRIVLLIATAAFAIPGFIAAVTLWILVLALQRSYNTPYLWPFIPFDAKAMLTVTVRRPFGSSKKRPSITHTIDSTRQPT